MCVFNGIISFLLCVEQANAVEFPRDFLGISLPEQPNKYYFVLRGQRLVLEAESSIQIIMEKLQSYKTRVALSFEVSTFPHTYCYNDLHSTWSSVTLSICSVVLAINSPEDMCCFIYRGCSLFNILC